MPETIATAVIPAGVDAVWGVVREFNGLPTWHPAIATSELESDGASDRVGAVRHLGLAGDDGGEVREVLAALNDSERTLVYEILSSPFPVRLYRSTIQVFPVTETGESFVAWSVVFDCDASDADQMIGVFRDGVYATGLRGLREHFGGSAG